MTVRLFTISAEQRQALQKALDKFGETLPGCGLTVASDSEVLFDGRSGKFDALEKGSSARAAGKEDILWFASTTKLITSVGECPSVTVSLCKLNRCPQRFCNSSTRVSSAWSQFSPSTTRH